jgi:predicted RNase H-like HicB family nuclease
MLMHTRYILTEYLDRAMGQAEFDKLEDGTFAGRVGACKGVIAFGATLRECAEELRSTLEDWLVVGLKLGHAIPVVEEIDLNKDPLHEPVDSL